MKSTREKFCNGNKFEGFRFVTSEQFYNMVQKYVLVTINLFYKIKVLTDNNREPLENYSENITTQNMTFL